jgi:hypothetical protein
MTRRPPQGEAHGTGSHGPGENPGPRGGIRARLARGAGLLLGVVGAAAGAAFLALSRPFAPPSWEPAPPHPPEIYQEGSPAAWDDPTAPLVSPFHLEVDPMEALLLVNIEGDPDRIYVGFEPQAFDDPVHGRGLLVIGWRVDGRVDVFHEPGLRLDPATYGIAGEGLHRMEEREFLEAHLAILPQGVQARFAFADLEGRPIRIEVEETARGPRRPFGLLAPMGAAAAHPPSLPLVFLRDFDFVRRRASRIRVVVDGRLHAPDRLPLPVDGQPRTFLRYSPGPFIVTWNPEGRVVLPPLVPGDGGATDRGIHYAIRENHGQPEIRSMRRRDGGDEVVVAFEPSLPRLLALREGVTVTGAFRISAHPSMGVVTGGWSARREGGAVHLEAVPDGGWTPSEGKRSVRLMFRLVSTFRNWPTTYRWRGVLSVDDDVILEGGWERIP